jgi:hypothetical protein
MATARTRPAFVQSNDYDLDINPLKPGNAGIAARELLRIMKKYGYIDSDLVLQEADDPNNPIHPMFPWDDQVAGHRYRLIIASKMIQAARIIWKKKQIKTAPGVVIRLPAYPSIGHGQRKERATALNDADARQYIITAKLKSLRSTLLSVLDIDELDQLRINVLNEVTKTAAQLGIAL